MENIQQLKEEIKTLFNLLTYEDQVQIIEMIKESYFERSRV